MQIGGEQGRRIEAARRDGFPPLGGKQLGVHFPFPQHLQRLSLGVVIETRQTDQRGLAVAGWGRDVLDQVLPLADADQVAGLGEWVACHEAGGGYVRWMEVGLV